nr:hypothetical protein L203_05704 [Cryptococcus depauperatus CBS 7841]
MTAQQDLCVKAGGCSYSYFANLGKIVQVYACSVTGPKPSDYVIQPVESFECRLGQTKSVEACGAPGADFSYVYKTTKQSQGKLVMETGPNRIKKLGKRPKNEEPKKYDNLCDDPNSVLGCCRLSEQDLPVFHDRTQL